jgi:GAF domain-containing protein
MILRQFGAHVAVAIENARLFEQQRAYAATLETLVDLAREFGAILNVDELPTRLANLTRRVIDYAHSASCSSTKRRRSSR